MNPSKVDRNRLNKLTDLPNVGQATAGDLMLLGINHPQDLIGRDAQQMYQQLCELTSLKHDPCVIDVFESLVSFMSGEPPKPWWEFTHLRHST